MLAIERNLENRIEIDREEDMKALEAAIDLFLNTRDGLSRKIMHATAETLMRRNGIYEHHIENKNVTVWIPRRREEMGVGFASLNFAEADYCPMCAEKMFAQGSKITLLTCSESADVNVYTYGCGNCGSIFAKRHPKEIDGE